MKIHELHSFERKETPIHYIRSYKASARMDLPGADGIDIPVEFRIENTPGGTKDIEITLPKNLEYPVLPIKQSLKGFIKNLDLKGKLP
ncbi:MAG: hypothetical protein K9L68_03110 [Spirochaetales bacterium]|nr:hypothetical protein [Spirochaetales bacterium]MCF7937566.1 hypothetical protein [Spirochaetales bacterium]